VGLETKEIQSINLKCHSWSSGLVGQQSDRLILCLKLHLGVVDGMEVMFKFSESFIKKIIMHIKFSNNTIPRTMGFIFLIASIVAFSAFTGQFSLDGDKDKMYIVAKSNAKYLSKKVEAQLYKAILAGYKQKPLSVELLKEGRQTFLSWSFGVENGLVENMSVALKPLKGNYVIDFGGPLSLTNCITTTSCSCCKTDCSCSKKNGGQEDCGSSDCDKREVDNQLPNAMVETLLG